MLSVQNVRKSYNGIPVVNGVSLALRANEMIGLVGPSGGGKSVLLKMIGGIAKPDEGKISFGINGRQSVGVLFQESALFDSMSVLENVAFPLFEKRLRTRSEKIRISKDDAYQQAYEALGEVGLADAYNKHTGQLSGGMRRRVGIARALVAKPKLVLLDDPTGGLDPVAASVIMNLICRIQEAHNLTMILVSHDIRRLLPCIERLLVLMHGKIACDLPLEKLQSQASSEVMSFLATRYDFSEQTPS